MLPLLESTEWTTAAELAALLREKLAASPAWVGDAHAGSATAALVDDPVCVGIKAADGSSDRFSIAGIADGARAIRKNPLADLLRASTHSVLATVVSDSVAADSGHARTLKGALAAAVAALESSRLRLVVCAVSPAQLAGAASSSLAAQLQACAVPTLARRAQQRMPHEQFVRQFAPCVPGFVAKVPPVSVAAGSAAAGAAARSVDWRMFASELLAAVQAYHGTVPVAMTDAAAVGRTDVVMSGGASRALDHFLAWRRVRAANAVRRAFKRLKHVGRAAASGSAAGAAVDSGRLQEAVATARDTLASTTLTASGVPSASLPALVKQLRATVPLLSASAVSVAVKVRQTVQLVELLQACGNPADPHLVDDAIAAIAALDTALEGLQTQSHTVVLPLWGAPTVTTASSVSVVSSADGWKQRWPMILDPASAILSSVVRLPTGDHAFAFVVCEGAPFTAHHLPAVDDTAVGRAHMLTGSSSAVDTAADGVSVAASAAVAALGGVLAVAADAAAGRADSSTTSATLEASMALLAAHGPVLTALDASTGHLLVHASLLAKQLATVSALPPSREHQLSMARQLHAALTSRQTCPFADHSAAVVGHRVFISFADLPAAATCASTGYVLHSADGWIEPVLLQLTPDAGGLVADLPVGAGIHACQFFIDGAVHTPVSLPCVKDGLRGDVCIVATVPGASPATHGAVSLRDAAAAVRAALQCLGPCDGSDSTHAASRGDLQQSLARAVLTKHAAALADTESGPSLALVAALLASPLTPPELLHRAIAQACTQLEVVVAACAIQPAVRAMTARLCLSALPAAAIGCSVTLRSPLADGSAMDFPLALDARLAAFCGPVLRSSPADAALEVIIDGTVVSPAPVVEFSPAAGPVDLSGAPAAAAAATAAAAAGGGGGDAETLTPAVPLKGAVAAARLALHCIWAAVADVDSFNPTMLLRLQVNVAAELLLRHVQQVVAGYPMFAPLLPRVAPTIQHLLDQQLGGYGYVGRIDLLTLEELQAFAPRAHALLSSVLAQLLKDEARKR